MSSQSQSRPAAAKASSKRAHSQATSAVRDDAREDDAAQDGLSQTADLDVVALAEQRDAAALAGRLRAARSRGRAALARHQRQDKESWAGYLLPAARQLEEVLTEFLNFAPVWQAMRTAEATTGLMEPELVDQVTLVFDQDISGLLDFLGYSPPPPSEEMALDVVTALADVLGNEEAALASRTARRAQHDLTLFVLRLRACIEQAEEASSPAEVPPSVRHRLVSGVQRAVITAGPAVLASAAVAYALPTSGAAAAGLGVAAHAAGRKALEIGVTTSSASLLTRAVAGSAEHARPEELREAGEVRVCDVARDLANALQYHREQGSRADLVRPLAVEAVSAVYALRASLYQAEPDPGDAVVASRLDDVAQSLAELLEAISAEGDWSNEGLRTEDQLLGLLWALPGE